MTGKRLLAILLCVAVQQQADGSFKAVNGEGTPENLIVDTLALKSESWNEKSEGYRGIAADLMKGIAVAAGSIAQSMDMKAPEIKLGESSRQKDTAITQQSSSLNAGEQLVLAAKDNVTLIGAEVSTEGTAILSGKNVTLEAAEETRTSETSHSEHTVGGLGGKLNKDEVSLGGMQEVETTETTRTTSTTHKGTSLSAGNLAVLATEDVNIVASNVKVEENAIVQAGGDVNVTGKQATSSTETRTDIETTTVAAAVRNAYVDAGMAVKALKDAYDAAKDADKAYDEAKKRVDSGELAKAALKDYETNRTMAAANLAQAEIAAAAAIAGAAGASATMGFYASASAQTEVTTTSTTQTASIWQGSSIDAGSLVISGKNTTIEGSDITAGWLTLDSDKVLITAGIDQYKTETSSSTKSVTASGGTNGSGSASASTSSSQSSSTSLRNVNSTINVGHLESDAGSFTLRGAEVTAQTADLNVGSLTVQSLQDTSSSSNSSKSTNVGAGFGGGGVSSVNAGFSNGKGSSESSEVGSQTQLLITDGANSQITAKDTTLIGGLIANATQNKDGTLTDHGKLNLTTGTLTVSDLEDKSKSEQSSMGLQASSGTTTVSMSKQGHKTEGETQATLGQGNITVGGTSLDEQDQFADLNRDVNEAQITTLDQQTAGLNASVSVDNRWLTEDGRKSLENEQKKAAAEVVTGAAKVGAAVTAAVADSGQIGNAWNMVGKGQDLAYADDGKTAAKIEAVRDGEVQAGQTAQGIAGELVGALNPDGTSQVRVTEGMNAYGAYNENTNTIYLEVSGETRESIVNTAAHEVMHAQGANETTSTVTGYMTDLAYQVNAWANSDQIDNARSQMVFAPANAAADQALIQSNNMTFREAEDRGQLEYRQLDRKEASQLDQARAAIDGNSNLTEAQKQEQKSNLNALACAQVRCADGVSENDPHYDSLKALQDKGNELQQGGQDLRTALASNGVQDTASSFTYTDRDAAGDWLSSREDGVALVRNGLRLGSGIASTAAGAGLAAGGCSTAVGCPLAASAAALLVGQGARDISAGTQGLLSPHEYQWGQNVYASLSGDTHLGNV